MKTARYYITFENLEHQMSTPLEITKTQYTEQLKHLREQTANTKNDEYPVEEKHNRVYDHPTTIENVITFMCGTAYTDLIKIECKPGYCFKAKR